LWKYRYDVVTELLCGKYRSGVVTVTLWECKYGVATDLLCGNIGMVQ
jgi:hypothetical protein